MMLKLISWALLMIGCGMVGALLWPIKRAPSSELHEVTGRPASGTPPSGASSACPDTRQEKVALAFSALEAARAHPRVHADRTLSELDRIAIRDGRGVNLKAAIVTALDDRYALMRSACPGFAALRNMSFRLAFEAAATPSRASVRNPSLRVVRGASLDPELESCILEHVRTVEVEPDPMQPFLDYVGPIEYGLNVGDDR
jgi:hypothetical protein